MSLLGTSSRRVALGLGSSLGDRRASLELAIRRLNAHPGLAVSRVSSWRRSPPMRGSVARGWFLNGVALLQVEIPLPDLMSFCKRMEAEAGRRAVHWGDRPLDLDILLSEGEFFDSPPLRVPHPGIAYRDFVLTPLAEVWPEAVDPRSGAPWATLPLPVGPLSFSIGRMRNISRCPQA